MVSVTVLDEGSATVQTTFADAIVHADIAPTEGFIRKTAANLYTAQKSNLAASTAPGVTDDSAAGYSVSSPWIDITADKWYICVDATVGAAVWDSTSVGGSGAFSDASDPVVLNTTTKDVVVGAAQISSAKLSVDGDADQVQLAVQAHSSQTANLAEWQDSSGTLFAKVTAAGDFSNQQGTKNEKFGDTAEVNAAVAKQTVVGFNATTTGGSSVAVGADSIAAGNSAAFGKLANANKQNALAMGAGSTAGTGSISFGKGSGNTNSDAVSLGSGSNANAQSFCAGTGSNSDASGQIAYGGSTDSATLKDMILGKGGAAVVNPADITIRPTSALGTDIAGADFTFIGGKATGNAAGGNLIFQTSDAGSSGTTLQPLTTKVIINAVGNITLSDTVDFVFNATTGTKIGTATSQKLSLWGVTPVVQPTALTAQDSSISHTSPGTPEFVIQDLTTTTPFGFVTKDEGNTVLQVILNLQTRVSELETKLQAIGVLA